MYKLYLKELKFRIITSLISSVFCFIICYNNKEILFFICIKPSINNFDFYFVTTDVLEIFSIYLKVSFNLSFFLFNILLFYNIIMFIKTGLYKKEAKTINKILKCAGVVLILLNTINYFFIFPTFWSFFKNYLPEFSELKMSIKFEPKLIEYFKLLEQTFYFTNASSFVILTILTYILLKNNKIEQIKITKKTCIILILLLATMLTPPDVISQLSLAVCILFSFEIIFLLVILEIIKLTWKKIKT